MSESHVLTPLDSSEYDMIEAAVRESARGRWFLAEFARRNRSAETDLLLQAIGRLQNAVIGERGSSDDAPLRGDVMEMADAITRAKLEIEATSVLVNDHSRHFATSEALDAIVQATEHTTNDILSRAEEVQEAAWTLRGTKPEPEISDALKCHETQIHTAYSFQDLGAERISRIVHTLRYLEKQIASMIAIWGLVEDDPESGVQVGRAPAAPSSELNSSKVDRAIDMNAAEAPEPLAPQRTLSAAARTALEDDLAFMPEEDTPPAAQSATPAQPTSPAPAAKATDDLASAFGYLDRLSVEEKISLFV